MANDTRSDNAFERDLPGTNARTQAEAAIEELRQRGGVFVNAVRATRMPMVLTDPSLPGNPIVFANDAFLNLSGYRMEEVLGQQPHFMNGSGTDPKDAPRFAEMLRSEQDEILETVQYRKDGSPFVATVLLSAFKDEDGRTLNHFMSWLDVTRRAEAEREVAELRKLQLALQESEAKYRGLLNSIDEGFCIIEVLFDRDGHPTDYLFLEINAAFERQTGIEDAAGKRMREIAPDHEQHWFDIYGRIALTGEPERFEQPAEALGRYYEVYAFRVGQSDQNQVGILFNDISERKRAEQALRQREEQQAFLLKLTDALRQISDAREIQTTTARMVSEHLGADRAMYAEVEGEPGSERGTLRGQHVRGGLAEEVAPFPEHYSYGQFGQHTMAARHRGEPLVVADVQNDPAYNAEERAAWAQFGVRAAIVATLPKDGRLVAEFGVHSTAPREWTESEVNLIKEVAERTWAAAERARAEEALRASEEKYRSLFESMDEAYAVVDVLKDEAGNWSDFRFVEVNPAFIHHTGMPYPVGKKATELLGTPNPRWAQLYGQALDSDEPLRVEEAEPTLGLVFDLNIFSLDREQNRVAVLFTNITGRKQAEAALRESEAQLAAELRRATLLHDLSVRLVTEEDTAAIYEQILATAVAITEADAGTVQVYDPASKHLELLVTYGIKPAMADHFHRVNAGSSTACGIALRTGERTYVDFDEEEDEASRLHVEAGLLSAQATPVLSRDGSPIGMINTHWRESKHRASMDQLRFLDLLARLAAGTIEQRRSEEALRESERLRTAMLDVLPLGLALTNPNGEVVLANAEWARFIPTNRIPSRDQERRPRWRGWDGEGAPVKPENFPGARALRGERIHPPMEFLYTEDDGQEVWTSVGAVPFLDAAGNPVGAVCFIMNIDAAKRAQEALRESEQRYRLIVDNARYASIFTTDSKGMIDDWHEGAATIFGYSKEEIVGQDCSILFTVEDRNARQPEKEMRTAAETGKADNVRWHLRKDGSLVFIEGVSTALRDTKGALIGFLKVGLDATERRRAQEHEQTLLGELQHRVRNTLSVIRSIVRRTAQTAESVEQFEQNLDGRLSSFARTQAYVTRDPQGSIDLELLVRDELLAHAAGGNHTITINGNAIRLSSKQAESLGLAIHELTNNAIRHGALASEGNRIEVNWSLKGNGNGRILKFEWLERLRDGNLAQPARNGFGTELLERVLAYELDAETKLEFKPEGFCYQADIPLP